MILCLAEGQRVLRNTRSFGSLDSPALLRNGSRADFLLETVVRACGSIRPPAWTPVSVPTPDDFPFAQHTTKLKLRKSMTLASKK